MVVGLLAASGMLTSLQFTSMVPVLPLIPEILDTNAADASWLITVTLLVGVVGTPVMTRLADMHGRRRMLLASMALLAAGSIIAAAIPSFTAVLLGRALQGFGTSVVPIGIALLTTLVSRQRAIMGIALMSGTLGIGSALGLTLSGPLAEWGGLPAIFWTTALVSVAFCLLIRLWVDEVPLRTPGRFDYVGSALLAIALTALLLCISRGQIWGWTSPVSFALIATVIVSSIVWGAWELRHPNPVIDVRTAVRAPIAPINIASFFATFGMYANHLLTTQEALAPASTAFGLAAPVAAAGLFVLPSALTMILLAPVAARAISRLGARFALMFGAGIMTLAFLFRMVVHSEPWSVATGSALVGCGVAFAFAAMPSLITASVPRDQVAAANGVNSVVRSLSGAVAAALFAFVIATLPSMTDAAFLSHTALTISFGFSALCGMITVILALALRVPDRKDPQ